MAEFEDEVGHYMPISLWFVNIDSLILFSVVNDKDFQ